MTIRVRSYRRAGRLAPRRRHGLRAASVHLRPGGVMEWHSTQGREELLIVLGGRLAVDVQTGRGRAGRSTLKAGQCAWLPVRTLHRVSNRSRAPARYLYVTAPSSMVNVALSPQRRKRGAKTQRKAPDAFAALRTFAVLR